MYCPNCHTILSQIKVDSLNQGCFIVLEQCHSCGGVWLNQNELYQVPYQEAKDIETINLDSFDRNVDINKILRCPKDSKILIELKDFNIPYHIHLLQCQRCGGMWLNRGEITKFKEHIKNKQKELEAWEKERYTTREERDNILANIAYFFNSEYSRHNKNLPLIYNEHEAEILKTVPDNKKVEIYRLMMDERAQYQKEVSNTIKVLQIIIRILRLLIFKT